MSCEQHRNNTIGEHASIGAECIVNDSVLKPYARLKNNVEFRAGVLGEYSYISGFSVVNKTEIGKFCSIAHGVFIGLWEHNTEVSTHSFYLFETSGGFVEGYEDYKKDAVVTHIGNDVWVGANSVILKGVTVGDGAIVGAGAVVTKDVPPYAIVIGSPARVYRNRFEEQDRDLLMNVAWWNLDRPVLQEMVDAGVFKDFGKFKEYCLTHGLVGRSAAPPASGD